MSMSDDYCRKGFDSLHRIGALYERLSPSREPEFHNRFQGILVRAREVAEAFQVFIIRLNPNAIPGVDYQQAFARLQQELDRIEQEYEAERKRRRQQPANTHPERPIATSACQKLKEFPDTLAHRADTQREAIIQKSLGVDHLEDSHCYVLSPPGRPQK